MSSCRSFSSLRRLAIVMRSMQITRIVMPIAMAASTVFSFLGRRFLTAIMHGFERRFLFPAHGCFCGGCCPRCPRACSGLGRAALCFSRWFLDLPAPLLWLWGEVFPRGVLLVSRGRSVATGATTQAPWWLALSRRAGCGGVLRVAGAWRVVCVARHTLPHWWRNRFSTATQRTALPGESMSGIATTHH